MCNEFMLQATDVLDLAPSLNLCSLFTNIRLAVHQQHVVSTQQLLSWWGLANDLTTPYKHGTEKYPEFVK